MRYCSTYLWEKGKDEENSLSLMLQQVRVAKRSVLFACICGLEKNISGRFSEALVEWFHREALTLLERKGSMQELERSLEREMNEVKREIAQYRQKNPEEKKLEYAGILMVEQWFCLFGEGDMQVYLVNRRFNRKSMRMVERAEKQYSGEIQKKVGLLLCTPDFMKGMDLWEVAQLLMPEGEIKEERMQKRLQELWEVRKETSGNTAAVYLRTY